jgi:hypothetical protein
MKVSINQFACLLFHELNAKRSYPMKFTAAENENIICLFRKDLVKVHLFHLSARAFQTSSINFT